MVTLPQDRIDVDSDSNDDGNKRFPPLETTKTDLRMSACTLCVMQFLFCTQAYEIKMCLLSTSPHIARLWRNSSSSSVVTRFVIRLLGLLPNCNWARARAPPNKRPQILFCHRPTRSFIISSSLISSSNEQVKTSFKMKARTIHYTVRSFIQEKYDEDVIRRSSMMTPNRSRLLARVS